MFSRRHMRRLDRRQLTVYWQTNPVKTNLADLGLYWSIDDALSRAATLSAAGQSHPSL